MIKNVAISHELAIKVSKDENGGGAEMWSLRLSYEIFVLMPKHIVTIAVDSS